MLPTSYAVHFFRFANRRPVEDFILQQDKVTRAKIDKCVRLLITYGAHAGWPIVKKVEKGLYELRIRGSTEIRFIFITVGSDITLLHGFKKKSQKLPLQDLRLAKKRLTQLAGL